MVQTMAASSLARSDSDRYLASPMFVVAQPTTTIDALVHQHTAWVQLPSGTLGQIVRIQQLTGWSFREIAEVLRTSHTTVGKLANGAAPTPRSQDAVDRLGPLLDVLTRISGLVPPGRALSELLHASTASGGQPIEYLVRGEWAEALLAALDATSSPRPKRPKSLGPRVKAPATQELP
jgi:transcriptional regulator with XRE-family HTH domain